jgi:hypothetical protein
MNIAREICDLLEARASSGDQAFQMSKALATRLIAVLRRRFGINYLDAELLLADVMREHEDALYAALHERVSLDDALDAVHRCFGGSDDALTEIVDN